MIKQLHSVFAFALCLIIAFGPVIASAHDHDDHEESNCSVTVFQHCSAAVTTDIVRINVTTAATPIIVHSKDAVISRVRACQLARAPPFHL
jgi:hypothetical protein